MVNALGRPNLGLMRFRRTSVENSIEPEFDNVVAMDVDVEPIVNSDK